MADYTREDEEFYGDPETDELVDDIAEPTKSDMEFWASIEPDDLQPTKTYLNHCWNCGAPISSEFCKRDPVPEYGYICNNCGKSLRELKEGSK